MVYSNSSTHSYGFNLNRDSSNNGYVPPRDSGFSDSFVNPVGRYDSRPAFFIEKRRTGDIHYPLQDDKTRDPLIEIENRSLANRVYARGKGPSYPYPEPKKKESTLGGRGIGSMSLSSAIGVTSYR